MKTRFGKTRCKAALMLLGCAFGSSASAAEEPHSSFADADANASNTLSKAEARDAGLLPLVASWQQADTNQNHVIDPAEFAAFTRMPSNNPVVGEGLPMKVGQGRLKAPETVLWDDQADVYLVSNVNGGLTALDDNGFISRLSPDGRIPQLRWIDGSAPDITLNGPKGMLFWRGYLVVADVKTVRLFERSTGKPVRQIPISGSAMLNDLAVGGDGRTLYVTDTGAPLKGNPGAVYAIAEDGSVSTVAEGPDLERPDGLAWHEGGLLVTPFGADADTVYRLTLNGKRQPFAKMPHPQLDGLLELPDGSFAVTSWKGHAVYRVSREREHPETMAEGIPSPAQIGFDAKRQRLLVPALEEDEVRIYPAES